MTTYERQQLSKIANQWFTVNRRNYSSLRSDCLYYHKENFKTLLEIFINTVLLLLDVKLVVYGENRRKPKLICLQYATLYSTTQVLLFEIFQISLIWYQLR